MKNPTTPFPFHQPSHRVIYQQPIAISTELPLSGHRESQTKQRTELYIKCDISPFPSNQTRRVVDYAGDDRFNDFYML